MVRTALWLSAAATLFLVPASHWSEAPPARHRLADPQLGEPIQGLTAAQLDAFDNGLDQFTEVETIDDGIGPAFNGKSCAECHVTPAIGGSAFDMVVSAETRFAHVGATFDPLERLGGPLIQRVGLGDYAGLLGPCHADGEVVPQEANAISVRITTPLFGAGLIDEIPDWQIILGSLIPRGDGISGKVNFIKDAMTGQVRAGRFGWKAQQASLHTFSGDAYVNEMGVTSEFFPHDNKPQGRDIAPGCDPTADPENLEDVQAFFDFMRGLAPPPVQALTQQATHGGAVFITTGCASCHTPAMATGNSDIAALRFKVVRLFSDLLLHDVGTADGMEQGQAKGNEFRTAPLWGLASRQFLMHDGRARTIPDAIGAHGAEAAKARQRFNALNASEKAALLAFLRSI